MSNDYFKAQGWFKNYALNSQDSRGMFQRLVKEDEEAFRLASAETDKIKDMINEKFGSGTMKYGSEISQPPQRPDVIEIDAINEFIKRNPRAEGGRMRFDKGLEVKKYNRDEGYRKVVKDFVATPGPGTGRIFDDPAAINIVKANLNKIKKQKNNKNLFEWSEDSDWYRDLQKELNPNTKTGTNREYTNKLINNVVDEFFPGAYHGKDAIKNFRNDMVVKSFIQHLKSVGEFDGQEKFDKVLDQFTYKKDGKRKNADHLYEDINRSWKSWLKGEFEVDGIDRADLKKELKARGINYNQITNWSASSAQGRGTAKIKEIKWLDNQNSKFINRTPEQVKALFKKQFPNGNFELRINELTQLKRNGVYVSGANTEKGITGISKGDRAGWLKEAYGKQFAGNYSKIINAADQLAAAGETAKAERLYKAADKFFGPTGIIRKSAVGEAEHALARSFDFLNPDRQLAINSIVDGDLNQFKKNLFDIPVKQYFDEYNKEGTTDARKKELKNLIENRKKIMNSLTGGQKDGIVAGDIVSFQYGDKIKPTSSVKAIDVLFDEGKFDIDEYIAKGNAYGDALKKTGLKIDKSGSVIGEDKLKEIETYITDRTGKVKQPMFSSGFAGAYEMLSDDLKAITNSEGFKKFKANIANPALTTAVKAAKLPTKIFGAADLVLGYLDYSNNRQKGFSKEDSTKHMVDAILFGATSLGEKADIEGVKKIAMQNGMSEEVFNNLVNINTNQKAMINRINESKAKFNESMDIIESGTADPVTEKMLIQKLKVDTKKFLTNTMKDVVDASRSLNTNLQVQEAGAPININVDTQQQKAFSDLGSASREFVQKRIDASDLEKIANQKDTTKGGIGDAVMSGLKAIYTQPKFIYDLINPLSPLPKAKDFFPKDLNYKAQMEQLKKEDPTMYYKMLMSEGVDPRINLNIPVQLEFEQKYPEFGTQLSDSLTQNKSEGGITELRSKYEYKK